MNENPKYFDLLRPTNNQQSNRRKKHCGRVEEATCKSIGWVCFRDPSIHSGLQGRQTRVIPEECQNPIDLAWLRVWGVCGDTEYHSKFQWSRDWSGSGGLGIHLLIYFDQPHAGLRLFGLSSVVEDLICYHYQWPGSIRPIVPDYYVFPTWCPDWAAVSSGLPTRQSRDTQPWSVYCWLWYPLLLFHPPPPYRYFHHTQGPCLSACQ